MGVIDSGYGWYADENWMRRNSGLLGTLSVPSIPTYFTVTPEGATALRINGIYTLAYTAGSGSNKKYYYINNPNNSDVYVWYISNSVLGTHGVWIASTDPDVYFTRGSGQTDRYNYNLQQDIGGVHYYLNTSIGAIAGEVYENSISRAPVVTIVKLLTPGTSWNPNIPEHMILGNNPAVPQATVSKTNTGYAVACWVKYTYSGATTSFYMPVLISSSHGYVTMTESSSSETLYEYMRAYQGKMLYIDVLWDGWNVNEYSLNATGAIIFDVTSTPFSAGNINIIIEELWPMIIRASSFHWGEIDPYSGGGETEPGGGGGTYVNPSTPVSIPELPSYSYANAGFFSIWIPDDEQINSLSSYMWNADALTIDFWKRLVADPIDLVIGLSVVPFNITPTGASSVALGFVDTGVLLNYTNKQYFEVDCGSVTIEEYWGAYLDYNPYTKIEIFLPYIGARQLDADECMGKTIQVVYKIDIVSGACVALIKVDNAVLYRFEGNCAVVVPVTSFQMQGLITKIVNTGLAGGAMLAGAGGALAAGAMASSAMSLASTKATVPKTGGVTSAAGLLDVQTPYLVITRPRQAIPANQNTYTGYPSFITETLGNLSGYTEVEAIHLDNIPCTADELAEIDGLLKSGVIF